MELTRVGEQKVEEGNLAGLIRDCLKVPADWPVFIPSTTYVMGGRMITLHLMEGYAFVASGLPEVQYIGLESTVYVRRILTVKAGRNGMRTLSVVPESSIHEMKDRLAEQVSSDVTVGMHVMLTDGAYATLEGEVVTLDGSNAHVRVQLRSLDLILKVPRVFLAPQEEGGS